MSETTGLVKVPLSIEGKERPRFTVAPRFSTLCIPTTDGSGSMSLMSAGGITKGHAVNLALRGLITRFKKSRYADNFQFGMVAFSDHAEIRMDPTPVTKIDDLGNYDPTVGLNNGTNIGSGLEKAGKMGEPFLDGETAGGVPRHVCILLLTDGEDGNEEETRKIANRLKSGPKGERITIATVYFPSLGDTRQPGRSFLHSLATSDGYTTDEHDPERIRDFFIKSLSQSAGLK